MFVPLTDVSSCVCTLSLCGAANALTDIIYNSIIYNKDKTQLCADRMLLACGANVRLKVLLVELTGVTEPRHI